jgi:nucleoside-diphosphate-sugar epimerase
MKILFIGGSGNISSACTEEALQLGYTVYHFNRGSTSDYSFNERVKTIHGDVNNPSDRKLLDDYAPFDVVVDFVCFTPSQIIADIDYFTSKTGQYIFISSATVYKKPPDHYLITEECPQENPYWLYAQNKINCEKILTAQHELKYTIIRPSYTYGKTWLPVAFTAREYNPIYRIRKGLPLISHGDGESLWVMTHHSDFAKAFLALFGNSKAMDNHFHITSDEVQTWDQIYKTIGRVVGIEPKLAHIPSDYINSMEPEWGAALLGDKARSIVFDNSKIKTLIPGWKAIKSFAEGIRESIQWFEERPERMFINEEVERKTNLIIQKFSTL